jgi:hypothetical protein
MITQSEPQIEELNARRAARDQLKERLTQARESLSQTEYRLDMTQTCIRLVEEEIRNLDSFSLAGVMSSLFGSKAGKIDACRRQCEDLQREQQQYEQAIPVLTKQVEQLTAELAGCADVAAEPPVPPPIPQAGLPATSHDARSRLQLAFNAAESLVNHLGGKFKLCSHLRSGPNPFNRCGPLIAAGVKAYKYSVASGVTTQIADSVRHLCDKVRQLELNPENPSDAELLAALARIENFADTSGSLLAGGSDAWAELEVLARGFASDLEERLSRSAS